VPVIIGSKKYILTEHMQLCGYRKLGCCIWDQERCQTLIYNKDRYRLILCCDGKTDIDVDQLSKEEKAWLEELILGGVIREFEGEENLGEEATRKETAGGEASAEGKLTKQREYRYFDNRYKESVNWSITGDCNYRCKHCFMSAPDAKYGVPDKEELFDIIRQMADCGIRKAALTGGEPLIRKDFLEIVEYMLQNGVIPTTIYTNGALVDDDLLSSFEKLGVTPAFSISFDGVGHHDWIRGIPGAEKRALGAIERLSRRGFPVSVTMSVHKNNIGSIGDTVRLLAGLGCDSLRVGTIDDAGCWSDHGDLSLTVAEAMEAYLDYIPKFFADGAPMDIFLQGCFAYFKSTGQSVIPRERTAYDTLEPEEYYGQSVCMPMRRSMYISPEGKVLPCMGMLGTAIDREFPTLKEHSLRDILNEGSYCDAMSCRVADYMEHNPKCKACKYGPKCFGGCRAKAVMNGSCDFLGPDPVNCEFYRGGWYDRFKAEIEKWNK